MTCRKCGQCCHDIPLNHREASMFRYIVPEVEMEKLDDGKYQYKLKGVCPFLREDKLCDIYSFRPHICRIFPLTDCEELSR